MYYNSVHSHCSYWSTDLYHGTAILISFNTNTSDETEAGRKSSMALFMNCESAI